MADSKVTDLTSAGTLDGTEVLYAVKDPSGTPLDRKTTAGAIKTLSIGAGSVSIASGKTFTASNTLTLAGTDSTTITFGSASSSFPIVTSPTAATLQLGAADAAAPVAQTFKVQSGTAGASALSCSISGTTLTVGGAVTGTIAIGHAVTGTNVSAGTVITAGSGVSWTVNNSQTVSSTTMYFNSVGADFTMRGSQGSGPSAGGSLIFQVAPAGSAATTAQNSYISPLQVLGTGGITGVDGATANTLALRNGTNAQRFNVYNTYTSSTNYETFKIDWITTANTCLIGTEKGSGGSTARALALQTDGTTRWSIGATTGHFLAGADNTYDIGAIGSRPRSVYAANSFEIAVGGAGTIALGNGPLIANYLASDSIDFMTSATVRMSVLASGLVSFGGNNSSFPALKRISSGNCLQVIAADNTASAGFIVGNQALVTTATNGFLYVPTCAGTPTGTPTTQTGTAPIVVDTTNNKLYFYSGGAWRDAGP